MDLIVWFRLLPYLKIHLQQSLYLLAESTRIKLKSFSCMLILLKQLKAFLLEWSTVFSVSEMHYPACTGHRSTSISVFNVERPLVFHIMTDDKRILSISATLLTFFLFFFFFYFKHVQKKNNNR